MRNVSVPQVPDAPHRRLVRKESCKPQSSWTPPPPRALQVPAQGCFSGAGQVAREPVRGEACRGQNGRVNCAGAGGEALLFRGLNTLRLSAREQRLLRSKATATQARISTARPLGQFFLPSAARCLEFIPGDHHCLFLEPFPGKTNSGMEGCCLNPPSAVR